MKLSDNPFATYKLLAIELERRGYNVSTDRQDGKLFVTFTAPNGKSWRTSAAHLQYPFMNIAALRLSDDKSAAYLYAQSKNIPTPFTRRIAYEEYINDDELEKILALHAPLIVKPNDASASKGLTLHIETVENVKNAVRFARIINKNDVLIQQQVSGEEIRFVVARGKVVAALLRQTPRVIGDGVRTVQDLIKEENLTRKKLVFPYITYPLLTEEIIDASYLSNQCVLKAGEVLEFNKATMIRNGCSVYEILDKIHQGYIAEIEKLTEDIDTHFLITDFLIDDYQAPPSQNNHWFLEFNRSPALKLFYGCRDGKMFDFIPLIADLFDEALT